MSDSLAVAQDVGIWVAYDRDVIQDQLSPFIQHVARLTSEGTLEDAVSRAFEDFPKAAEYFRLDPNNPGDTFGLRDEYLYSSPRITGLKIRGANGVYEIELGSAQDVRAIANVLNACSIGRHSRRAVEAMVPETDSEIVSQLIDVGVFVNRERRNVFGTRRGPGVHRLQHASLLYRGERSGVLVDPHLHSDFRPPSVRSDIYRDDLTDDVDAILISHFHSDHFNLSTLMMFPRDIPIVVPKVPRPTIICADMKSLLEECGFTNVLAVDWYSDALVFGDVRVHVLPFFGEQPLRYEQSMDSDIRNWGNTYVVETDQYCSWFLIDSGADVRGSMEDVAHYVRNRFDKIDFVLSNLRRFPIFGPMYINGGLNWLTLSPAQMKHFADMSEHCITLGSAGVANCCATVRARYYLPYAHWWGSLGQVADSALDTPGQAEPALVEELDGCLRHLNVATAIVPWRIGDSFLWKHGAGLTHFPIQNSDA